VETLLISAVVAVTVALISFVGQRGTARGPSVSVQERLSADQELLRQGLMAEVNRLNTDVAVLRVRVAELEKENRFFRGLLGERIPPMGV
jgi:hypothetical protein